MEELRLRIYHQSYLEERGDEDSGREATGWEESSVLCRRRAELVDIRGLETLFCVIPSTTTRASLNRAQNPRSPANDTPPIRDSEPAQDLLRITTSIPGIITPFTAIMPVALTYAPCSICSLSRFPLEPR